MNRAASSDNHLNERLTHNGFRFTPHRQHVYDALVQHRDHPTAEEVFIRVKKDVPEISMATVYNCLDALVKSGLVRLVNLNRGATRFCPNMQEHAHFCCDGCGTVFDLMLSTAQREAGLEVPPGFQVNRYDIAIHGRCPACTGKH